MKKYLPLLLVLFAPSFMLAQHAQDGHFCGTKFMGASPFHKAANKKTDFSKSFTTLYIPVTANFIGTDSGSGYYPMSNFLDALCKLNTDFEVYGFHFYLENVNYINNSAFYTMHPDTFLFEKPMYDFIEGHNTLNTMNTYIMQQAGGWSFVTWDEINEMDYSVYPPINIYTQNQSVVLDKDHLNNNDHLFTHEVGHYFGLWHTFWGDWDVFEMNGTPAVWEWEVIEPVSDTIYAVVPWLVDRVDGIDCDISGDLICDTPPDYLGGFLCNANKESDIVQTDPVGATFRSNGSYYMSYSNEGCQDNFSPIQVEVMRSVAEGPRGFLLYDQTVPQELLVDDLAMIYPPDGETVAAENDSIALEWDMPGADFFILTYGRKLNNSFFPIKSNVFLTDNQYRLKVSNPDQLHYWIVRGVSKYYPCEVWADTNCFTPTNPLFTDESKQVELLELYPNPTSNLLYLHFKKNAPAMNPLDAEILDVQGRTFGRMTVVDKKVDVAILPAGVYFLKVTDGERVYLGKFIKQ